VVPFEDGDGVEVIGEHPRRPVSPAMLPPMTTAFDRRDAPCLPSMIVSTAIMRGPGRDTTSPLG